MGFHGFSLYLIPNDVDYQCLFAFFVFSLMKYRLKYWPLFPLDYCFKNFFLMFLSFLLIFQ